MSDSITINKSPIGEGHPTYIIAEIGINHNGDVDTAAELIRKAADAGADAVKFQKRHLLSIYKEEVLKHPERYEQNFQYMIPLLKEVELPEETFPRLKEEAKSLGMDFLCTPFDIHSADFLQKIGLDAFKIASADLTNAPLLEHVAQFKKPIILSTGMSTWQEIEHAVSLLRKNHAEFALLHCRSVYPVWPRDVNLRMINLLKKFGRPVGYSGHELGITVSLVAASMGANIIEKHITLDKKQDGPDHKVSLEPHEFKRLVRDIRIADQAMGNKKRIMLRGEVLNRELFGKSLVADKEIEKGTIISREMIRIQGPGKGLAPMHIDKLVGRKARRKLSPGDYFTEEDIGIQRDVEFTNLFKSQWGLIVRFSDYEDMLSHGPRVLEFHLAERDLELAFKPANTEKLRLVVHAPEYMGEKLLDLCSSDSSIRRESVLTALQTIRLTMKIAPFFRGRPKVIVHPGAMSMRDKLNRDVLRENLALSLDEIRQHCKHDSFELLFENLPPYPWYFGGQWKGNFFMDADEIREFCTSTGMRICFDLSHAALYCNAKGKELGEHIETLLPISSHLHLADGYGLDGEGVQFGQGDIDLESVMPLFKGFSGTWVPEIWRGHLNNGRGFRQALAFLARYMD